MAKEIVPIERKPVAQAVEPSKEDKALAAAMSVLEESMRHTALLASSQHEITGKLVEIAGNNGPEKWTFRVTKRDASGKIETVEAVKE